MCFPITRPVISYSFMDDGIPHSSVLANCATPFVSKVENSYSISVPIFKQFHKNIIGKGGANIKKVTSQFVP